jgi:hypothetical protein
VPLVPRRPAAVTELVDPFLPVRPAPLPTFHGRPLATIPRADAQALAITDEASPFALRSTRNHPRRAMHQRCIRWRQRWRGGGAAGWWPTSPSSRRVGRSTTPASWPPTTSNTSLAEVSPQAAGTAPAPPPWGCRAKHPWPDSRRCSKVGTRRLASSSVAPMAATPCLPSTSCCGQPRACRSSTAG